MNELRPSTDDLSSKEGFLYTAFLAEDGRLRSIWRFVLSIFVILGGNAAAIMVASVTRHARIFNLIYRPLALVLVVAGFVLLLRLADEVSTNALVAMGVGFRKPWLKDAAKGLALGFGLVSIAYVVIVFTCDITRNVFWNERARERFAIEIAILAAGAMLEEVMFRGYPFQRLVESFGAVGRAVFETDKSRASSFAAGVAMVLWSGAFAIAHFWNPEASIWSFLNTALVGILFCIAYLRTRSLWMSWGIHFAWNTTLGVIFGLPVSGIREFSVISRADVVGPAWVTGGKYGIEASALGTAVIVLGIATVMVFVKQRAALTTDGTLTPISTTAD